MVISEKSKRALAILLWFSTVASLAGCVHTPRVATTSEMEALRTALTSLSPNVRETEAEVVARCSYDYARALALRYRIVQPPVLHNLLVNTGYKERGLCYEWAEDLLAELQTFHLESLELHWGIARADTAREHNSVVVTARSQPFEEGIVLDPWRRSGWLTWSPVRHDRYPWVEGELTNSPAPSVPQ